MKKINLKKLRAKIDQLDRSIIKQIAQRRARVKEVIKYKDKNQSALRDLAREEKVLTKVHKLARAYGLESYFVTKLFKDIINYSVEKQIEYLVKKPGHERAESITVAYSGTDFSYSHLAAQRYFASELERVMFVGVKTFRATIEAVEQNDAHYGVLPVENTTAGSINETYDLLNTGRVAIVGEEVLHVDHCIMTTDRTPLSRIRRIYAHPQAFQQCSDFLSTLSGVALESVVDPGIGAQKIKDAQDSSLAIISNETMAKEYGFSVLKKSIANQRENFTRFVVIAQEPIKYDRRIPCKTSLIISTAHQKGALVHCLNILAQHGLNMTKLESRPRPNVPWEYLFYIDVEGNLEDPNVKKTIDRLRAEALYLRVLGTYPIKTLQQEGARVRPSISKRIKMPKKAQKEAVTEVIPTSKHYHLASRLTKPENTQIKVGDVVIGGKDFVVIAGPCAVESEKQIMETAAWVKEHGGHILRGGVFKPRTSPYSFQGLGLKGLNYLYRAKTEYNLPIITEVLTPAQVELLLPKVDILQIGARNMQNFALLNEVGMVNKPVLLKRGMMATLEELLAAAEYILSKGNQQVILCERGIRTFETATRNTLDLSAIPVLKERTHLPIIIDPSHATGCRRWVIPLAKAALVCGANGIMVEIHPQPAKALSDGEQSLHLAEFAQLMDEVTRLSRMVPDK